MNKTGGRFQGLLAVLLLAIILLTGANAWARPTTAEEAKNVVINWLGLEAQPLDAVMSQQVKEVRSFAGPDGGPAYYVVFLRPRGLVIVAGDDLVEPIIGFLPEKTTYNPSKRNPLGALVSNDVTGRVLHARRVEARSLEKEQALPSDDPLIQAQRKWAWLADPAVSPQGLESGLQTLSDRRVIPFVKTRWGQTTVANKACYNYFTPPYAYGTPANYPAGCVATAMCQIMRHFRWPRAEVGTPSYTIFINGIEQSPEPLRGGDGLGGPYSWDDMPEKPVAPTTARRRAIGNLLHDAGAAAHMQYSPGGSGASIFDAATAFTGPFQYSNAIVSYNGGLDLPARNRDIMINSNLHARYPVLLGIRGEGAGMGHAVISDGYGYNSSTMYHHLNMGWNGAEDAWYNLPNVDLEAPYISVDCLVYNIYKTGKGEIISGRVLDSSGHPLQGATVTLTRVGSSFRRTDTTNAKGIYAFSKVPSASFYNVRATLTGYTFAKRTARTGTSASPAADIPTGTNGNVWNFNFKGTPQ
ncbi:MAG: peptidase C10 [Deltaproteobacteria bacterium]|nr:MAG: peptidase C10 [Deltaproteobacteria bacterium]